MLKDNKIGKLMDQHLLKELREKFSFLSFDPDYGERLFLIIQEAL